MPKGQTSRPDNRKEKKAVATTNRLKAATKNFSPVNKKKVMGGSKAKAAANTTTNRKLKAKDRKIGETVGKAGYGRKGNTAPGAKGRAMIFKTTGKGNRN
jgi:hypothetical protein|tara:strand:- start:419 stop:718 length:300 start_codon:yes stop_codon:yes gene_type:complete